LLASRLSFVSGVTIETSILIMTEWLPPLVHLSDYQGDFTKYLDAVYDHFKADFVDRKAVFEGMPISLKRHPQYQNKEFIFWHVTSEGAVEEERIPDMRRCERIRWIKPIIENANHPDVKKWENKRNGNRRICLWVENEDYLVVLDPRKDYILLWTAYMTNREHTRVKLRKEYQRFLKG
jgi:hypothetical protein